MQVYTCCPHSSCGSFQTSLSWLQSQGIEPSSEHDGHDHFFEFEFPSDWAIGRRIEFKWDLAHRVRGIVHCRCGHWLPEDQEGCVDKFACRNCGHEFLFCRECNAFEHWAGCPCESSMKNRMMPREAAVPDQPNPNLSVDVELTRENETCH